MARFALTAVISVVVGLLQPATAHGAEDHVDQAELDDAAAEAGVDAIDLRGAVNSTGLAPRAYLLAVGELVPAVSLREPPPDALDRLVGCLAWAESRNDPSAYNRRSGATGLLQFLPSTWMSTPYAGSSIWDSSAQWQAARWMVSVGRLHEWSTWRMCA